MRNQDKFRGCLIGGAAGDALGYAIEFLSEQSIFHRYGENGITRYHLKDNTAQFSDDTQMTLFTANGLLLCTAQQKARNSQKGYAECINLCYLDWLKTQERRYPLQDPFLSSWLANLPELFSPRAPGGTCLSALSHGGNGTPEHPINNSKGCGGIMRVAPIGLYFNDRNIRIEEICQLGARAAALTHGHPLGWMPAAALVQIVHEVSQDDRSIDDAVKDARNTLIQMWPESDDRQYLVSLLGSASQLAHQQVSDLDAIHQLGEGWVGEEALAIAVYCALRYPDNFEKALIASVNHRGDSDSTGAITGNILGAKLGLSAIPVFYTDALEQKDLLTEISDDLLIGCPLDDQGNLTDPVWIQKYVDATYTG